MGDLLGWLGFFITAGIALYVLWEAVPDAITGPVEWSLARGLRWVIWGIEKLGQAFLWLLGVFAQGMLWALGERRPRALVATQEGASVNHSTAPAAAYVANATQATPQEAQTAHGLSGLSAPATGLAAPSRTERVLETLDSGSRKRAVALLLLDDWKTGQIRKVLTGDNGEIGREAAELRVLLGLEEEEEIAPRVTPVAGRQTGAEFRGPPVPAE